VSELTKKIREAMADGTIVHRYPTITQLCDAHERLEADLGQLEAEYGRLESDYRKVVMSHNEQAKLLDPAVVEAARSLKRNADKHPDGCCSKCRAGLAELAQLREQLHTLGNIFDKAAVRLAKEKP